MRKVDSTGRVFGRLTVVRCVGNDKTGRRVWECLCACGNTVVRPINVLATGNTTSCGCYLKERITKHGGTGKGSYNTWRAMMRRCYNPRDKDYPRYGARGVTVCGTWRSYEAFAADMGEPSGAETLDRIDPYGNYSKENCRWAGVLTQARNQRRSLHNKSGYTGVTSIPGGKWMAKLGRGKKTYYSKVFVSIEEAVAARVALENEHWGGGR